MQVKFSDCIQCGKNRPVNSKGICQECIFKINHNGKSQQEVYSERQRAKQGSKPKSYSSIKYKPKKATGERDLFLEIWEERPHFCQNPKCPNKNCEQGTFLGDEPLVYFFSHIKSKGAFPELRLVKTNIEILCGDCHHQEDFGTKIKRE